VGHAASSRWHTPAGAKRRPSSHVLPRTTVVERARVLRTARVRPKHPTCCPAGGPDHGCARLGSYCTPAGAVRVRYGAALVLSQRASSCAVAADPALSKHRGWYDGVRCERASVPAPARAGFGGLARVPRVDRVGCDCVMSHLRLETKTPLIKPTCAPCGRQQP
jgi:hypothetical protein